MSKSSEAFNKVSKLANVNGVYWGEMKKDGKSRGFGLVVTVSKKVPVEQLKDKDLIPKKIGEDATDVIEVGELFALAKSKAKAVDRTADHRPVPMGVSVGHVDITAGTSGWIVYKSRNMRLLSNNHVLANVNAGVEGDVILQRGKHDGGKNPQQRLGVLDEFVPIEFGGTDIGCPISDVIMKLINGISNMFGSSVKFGYTKTRSIQNLVDCAIMMPDRDEDLTTTVVELGDLAEGNLKIVGLLFAGSEQVTIANKIQNVENALGLDPIANKGPLSPGVKVWKSGRTTGVKEGTVISIDYTGNVNMGEGRIATFAEQILINTPGFSAGGDSGSAVVRRV
jgi:hypothetical protein